MSDFNVRADSVDVEQVMEQIRARIREKRGVDYTEQQLRELAAVKLEKFLDPRGVRSDLLLRFKERQPQYEKPLLPLYTFEDTTIYETHRGPLRWIRNLLNPILKMLFNPNPIIHALHAQVEINTLNLEREEAHEKSRIEKETLYYEIIHNLVFELTRTGIEVKNLKMRLESVASRLEFNERRARALESVVIYKPSARDDDEGARESVGGGRESVAGPSASDFRPQTTDSRPPSSDSRPPSTPAGAPTPAGGTPEGPGQRSRRRRRRRGRRGGGAPASVTMGGFPPAGAPDQTGPADASDQAEGDSTESSNGAPVEPSDRRPEPDRTESPVDAGALPEPEISGFDPDEQ